MTTSLSSAKRARQNEKRRLANRARASAVKTAIRRVEQAVTAGKKDEVAKAVANAFRSIDKAARNSVIHANTAARRKALVSRKAAALKA
jgi:small subunit ribosomal protein S20